MSCEELVVEYQKTFNKQVLDEIVKLNKSSVEKMANRFYTAGCQIEREDLIQEGYIGAIIACKKYDINNPRRATFKTYAIYWVYKKMNDLVHSMSSKNQISIHSKLNDSNDEIGDTIADQEDYILKAEESIYNKEVRAALDSLMESELTLFERNITKLLYGWDCEASWPSEVAETYGADVKHITKARSMSLSKLRNTKWGRLEGRRRYHERYDY